MTRNYSRIAEKYAKDVISGKISACLYVKQACERHLNDLKRENFEYEFNPQLIDKNGKRYRPGDRVCGFIELLKHVKGKWRGKPFILEPWQVFIVCVGFGWVHIETKLRRFREIYLEVPRKNGKSFLSAAIGLYMFIADEEYGAEVFVGANGEHQANKVFAPAWQFAEQDFELRNHFNIEIYGRTPETGRLGTNTDYSRMERLIGNPKDGDMPSCYCCDEFHEHDNSYQYDTMSTGMGSREKPMIIITTTAGVSKDGPCYEKRAQCIDILNNTIENNRIFALIYTIDQKKVDGELIIDDWKDINIWYKANPNLGVSFFEDYVKQKILEAKQTPSKQAIILCKNLDIWLDSYNSWLDPVLWPSAEDKTIKEEDFINDGCPCYEGADLAAISDLVSRVKVYIKDNKYYVFSRFYLPEASANDEAKTNYKNWVHYKYIETNLGRTIDFEKIGDDIYKDIVNCNFKEFVIDSGFSAWPVVQRLQRRLTEIKGKKTAANMIVEYGKTVKNFSEPMNRLEGALMDGTLIHDGNPVLAWCMGNIVVKYDKKDNIFATKEGRDNKIDGGDALITAFARAMMHENDKGDAANDGSLI